MTIAINARNINMYFKNRITEIDKTKMRQLSNAFNSTLMRILTSTGCMFLPNEHIHANAVFKTNIATGCIR
jgi:hypothetical protein